MSQRATRLLHLLDELRRRRRPVRGEDLAARLGVSLRTLYRDIAVLRGQGACIDGDPGVGYRLRSGFLLPPMRFSNDELEALVLGMRWVSVHADPGLAEAADSALDRIVSLLPEELRLEVETSGLFSGWKRSGPEPWLQVLRHAIRDEHAVRMRYSDADGRVSERVVWPFAMAFFDDVRLLAAWCELRCDFRHFRADRVLALEDTWRRYPERRHALLRRWREQCLGKPPAGADAADRS